MLSSIVMFGSWMIAIVKLIALSNCLSCVESNEGDSCSATYCSDIKHPKLVRLDGVKVRRNRNNPTTNGLL